MEKKYQIFISSTYEDLKEERKKVQDTILSMYQFPIGMEMFSAADEEQWEIIRETIDSSDYYILIIGHRYGSVIEQGEYAGISYTQKEFRYALEQKIPVLAFLMDDSVAITPDKMEQDASRREKLEQFKDEVKNGRMVQWWTSKDDLAIKVMNSLNKQIGRKNRPGWIRADRHEKKHEFGEELSEIINTVQNDNILEFNIFVKYIRNVKDYRFKFKNKYNKYMDEFSLAERQCMVEKGIDQKEFYSKYYDDFVCEWLYIGEKFEKFCTKLNIDFALIAKRKKIQIRDNKTYKRYQINDAWQELEQFIDDKMFIYGAYVLSKILQGKKQNILKEGFEKLIYELICQNYFTEFESSSNLKKEEESLGIKKKIIPISNDNIFKFNVSGGQVNISNDNAVINAIQNNGINKNELDDIIRRIMENLLDLKKEDADEIADIVEMAKAELIKPEPKMSRLRNCLALIAPTFTIANGIPALAANLQKLQEFISLHIH